MPEMMSINLKSSRTRSIREMDVQGSCINSKIRQADKLQSSTLSTRPVGVQS